MRFLELGKRNFKEVYRDRIGLGFLLGMPLIFMVIMAVAFGDDDMGMVSLGIIDQDKSEVSSAFITEGLKNLPNYELSRYEDTAEAKEGIRTGNIVAFVVIPPGFGTEVSKLWLGQESQASLGITYDESDLTLAGRIMPVISNAALAFSQAEARIPIQIMATTVQEEPQRGMFQYIAPGMIVFGLTILISTCAGLIARDIEKGIISRLLTTPARPHDFILGYTLPLAVVGIGQIAIYLGVGFVLGLKLQGNIALATLIFLISALYSIGLGMILSSFIRQENQANPVAWLILVPMTMLSGAWFPTEGMPAVVKRLADLLPTTYAVDASRSVVVRGAGLETVGEELIILVGYSLALFLVGIGLFRRNMAR